MSLTELEVKPDAETSEETKKLLERLSNIEKRAKANDNYDNELNLGLKRATMFVLKLEEKNVSIEKFPLPNDSQIDAIPLPNVMVFESEVSLCWSFQLVITFWEDEVRVMGYQKGTEYIKWPQIRNESQLAFQPRCDLHLETQNTTTNNEENEIQQAKILEMIIEKFLTPRLS